MANQFETTYVPQQPLLKVEGGQRPHEPINLSLIISLVVFFVTLSVAGGAYFYQQKVDRQVKEIGEQLLAAESLFDIEKINTYKNLQVKLTTAKSLVDSHSIFSLIFDLIETRAAQNIGLTRLGFTQEGNEMFLSLGGQAPSYEAIDWQVQKWRESKPVVKNVEVNSIALEETSGIVSFGVKMTIDPSTIGYARMLAASGAKKESQASVTPVVAPAPVAPIVLTSTSTTSLFSSTTKVNSKATTTK